MRAFGLVGSALVHLGVLTCLLLQADNHRRPSGNNGFAQVVSVDITAIHAASLPSPNKSAQTPPKKPSTAPQRQEGMHTTPTRKIAEQSEPDERATGNANGIEGTEVASQAANAPAAAVASAGLDYQRRLLDHIRSFQRPSQTGLAGVIDMQFEIDRNGKVENVWIIRGSGYPLLDKEAINTVMRASPLPPVPQELSAPLMIQFPLSFDLL